MSNPPTLIDLYSKLVSFSWRVQRLPFWRFHRVRKARQLARRAIQDRSMGLRVVRLLSNVPARLIWPRIISLTPGHSCRWNNTLFVADGPADLHVILTSLIPPPVSAYVQTPFVWPERESVWGIHTEPSEYVRMFAYDSPEEHDHISRFYTNCSHLLERGGIYHPSPPYPFLELGKSWDFLSAVKPHPERHEFELGVICSALTHIPGHKERHDFLQRLDESGIRYALWGRGSQMSRFRGYQGIAPTKWGVHSRCRYSIVLENSVSDWYWSEKLSDCLLSYSMPLYHGSPRAGEFVPPESFIPIDIRSPDCVEKIRAVLETDPYEERLPYIIKAREILLKEQNIFAFLDREISRHFAL